MGNCIICGVSTDGPICEIHEEDAVFEFRGNRPDQLTEGRFYRGTVDGYADFGVFVDLGDGVTGLLHRSKLDRRLESLDWEPGDTVYVQVTNVRENGDVDLGWSIRQSEREFRGTLVDAPDGVFLPDSETESETESETSVETTEPTEPDEPETAETSAEPPADEGSEARVEHTGDEREAEPEEREAPERVPVTDLRERVGDRVRLEGEVVSVRQTGGPTVFELRDETAVVDCAAFEEAGVRAYPEIETGDLVRLDGEVRVRRDELQVETESLVALEGDERETVEQRMEDALAARAAPERVESLADDDAVAAATDEIREVATLIRRAVLESRPVVVRHNATADGYVAGAAIERAVLPLVREKHAQTDAAYHYFDRRPLEEEVYDMDDATGDVTDMLDDRERHDEKFPLFVFAAAARTRESADGLELLEVYDAGRVVVAGDGVDAEIEDAAGAVVAPPEARTASTLAATLAAAVNDAVRDDLRHLPAVSYWEDTPEAYVDLAAEAGVDGEAARTLREAVALEAYYHAYEDKRELVSDLLFERELGLAEQVATQFRTKMDAELETAEANLERREAGDVSLAVLDTDAYTHRFDFPPTPLLLDELHRREREGQFATVGVAGDELYLRSTFEVDLRDIAEAVRERAPDAGVSARGGKLEFLAGERDAVLEAVVEAVAERAPAPAQP